MKGKGKYHLVSYLLTVCVGYQTFRKMDLETYAPGMYSVLLLIANKTCRISDHFARHVSQQPYQISTHPFFLVDKMCRL